MVIPLRERDAMYCRSCGREERASEGFPCELCGTFICQICAMRGVVQCRRCREGVPVGDDEEILRVIEQLPDPPPGWDPE